MKAFLAIVGTTLRQLTGRKKIVGFGVLTLVPSLLLAAVARSREVQGLDTDLGGLLVTPFFAIVLPLTALILAGSALGDERRDKTLSFVVLRPVSRLKIAAAKTVAASIVSSGFAIVGLTGMCAVFAIGGGSFAVLPSLVVGAIVACTIYSSVFVLLGNVVGRPTLVGVLYVFFVENLLAGELPRLAFASPWRIGLAAAIDLMPSGFPARALLGALGELIPSLTNGLIATSVVGAVTVALCTLLLLRTDGV